MRKREITRNGVTIQCRGRREEYLKETARDNTQLLINKLWQVYFRSIFFEPCNIVDNTCTQLPVEKTDGTVAVEVSRIIFLKLQTILVLSQNSFPHCLLFCQEKNLCVSFSVSVFSKKHFFPQTVRFQSRKV